MLGFLIHFTLGYIFWEYILTIQKPRHAILSHAASSHVGEMQMRLVTLCHACVCCTALILYFFDVMPEFIFYWFRHYSCAFFIWDLVNSTLIRNRLNELGEDGILKNDPMLVVLHHVATIFLMYGYPFGGGHGGMVLFYLAEIPMIPLILTWYFLHTGEGDSWNCNQMRVWEIVSYGLLRVVCAPFFFLCILVPQIQLTSLLSVIFLILYVIVYIQNCIAFRKIVNLNVKPIVTCLESYLPKEFVNFCA